MLKNTLRALCLLTVLSGASQAQTFTYPTSDALRQQGYEVHGVVGSVGGLSLVMRKAESYYVCQLQTVTFNETREEFWKGIRCMRVL